MNIPRKWIVIAILVIALMTVYFFPSLGPSFDRLYAEVEAPTAESLIKFRETYGVKKLEVNGKNWEYIVAGRSNPQTILFLHGMTGSYDIWWQQIEALKDEFRVISLTYPAVDSLEEMDNGIITILDRERVPFTHIVGSSLGGYFAQYFVAKHPERVDRAVFANTFPPNDLIAEKNATIGTLLPFLPEWLVMSTLRGSFQESIYPTSGNSELVLAFLNEISYGRMSKGQMVGRYRCVIEKFQAPNISMLGIPVLIIESDNDPLVEYELREFLKDNYPTAMIFKLGDAGHFPYLSMADEYTQLLVEFLTGPIAY
jgi:pimeloyl-ACP methyl ester carboxylesterase